MTLRKTLLSVAIFAAACVGVALALQPSQPLLPSTAQDGAELPPGSAPAASQEARLLPVSGVRVEAVDAYTRSARYSGQLEARRSSELAFDRDGRVLAVLVEEGATVRAGEAIAELDSSRLAAQRTTALARRDQATARLAELEAGPRAERIAAAEALMVEIEQERELAAARLARREELAQSGAVAAEDLEVALRNSDVLVAQRDARQAALDELLAGTRVEQLDAQRALVASLDAEVAAIDVELDKCVLFAPFDGTVAERLLDEGQVVASGSPLVRLIESGVLEVRIGVAPTALGTLELGADHILLHEGRPFDAQLAAVLPELDTTTRTATLLFTLEPGSLALLPGEVVELELTEEVADRGFWLPVSALTRGERGLWASYALIAEEDGAQLVQRRDLEVLHTSGSRALVRGALNHGDTVIDAGLQRVVPGQRVQLTGELAEAR